MSEQQKEQQLLETVDRIIAEGPYQPAWSSLMQAKTPDWFKQKRFGIFIHWGVYSVPAFGSEWYSRHVHRGNARIRTPYKNLRQPERLWI